MGITFTIYEPHRVMSLADQIHQNLNVRLIYNSDKFLLII